MPLNTSFIGRSYGPSGVYEVSREKIRDFAIAAGDLNPAYLDADAARALGYPDVIAPPTFLTVTGFRFPELGPVGDPELGLDYSRVVHGEQSYVHHRPVVAGDQLVVTATVKDIKTAGRNELIIMQTDVSTVGGDPVSTMQATIVSRGTAA
jgi:acyl dehydratase